MRRATLLLLSWIIAAPAPAPGAEPDAAKIVEYVDGLYRSRSSRAEVEMEVVTPHWRRTLRMKVWTEGMEKTLIRILSPSKERGVATLRIGRRMWNYLPRVNKVIKIPPSMMMGSWMGSDFTNDDLVDEYTFKESYRFRIFHPEEEDTSIIYIECVPKEGLPIVWGKVVVEVRRRDWLPVRQGYYDEKGDLVRVLEFRDTREIGGRRIPTVLEMVPLKKQGHRTTIRYTAVEFDAPLDESLFTLRNLRSGG